MFALTSSLKAADPLRNGWRKFVFGWGPENYILAFGKYLHPAQFKYEKEWFDRSHNRFLDVLIMNGLCGLVAYVALWLVALRSILGGSARSRNKSADGSGDSAVVAPGLLFFGVSFFVHLLFALDHIATSLPFYASLSFAIHSGNRSDVAGTESRGFVFNRPAGVALEYVGGVLFVILLLGAGCCFITGTLPACLQMRKYISLMEKPATAAMTSGVDSVFSPFTVAQMNIRKHFLIFAAQNFVDKADAAQRELFAQAVDKAEEYAGRRPYDFQFAGSLADVMSIKGANLEDRALIRKGEDYFRKGLAFAPDRLDYNYGLALNLAHQKRYDESRVIMERVLRLDEQTADSYLYFGMILWLEGARRYGESFGYCERAFGMKPELFRHYQETAEKMYGVFFEHFYRAKDRDSFVRATRRLAANHLQGPSAVGQILGYMEQQGGWPTIDFE